MIVTDETTDQDFALDALPRFDITGVVRAAEDGAPIEGASVLALGTPVPAAITDAAGAYTLTLPIGTYTIRGSAGGCTEVQIIEGVELTDSDITAQLRARRASSTPSGTAAVRSRSTGSTRPTETALYGDDWVGRLRLPFSFAFYGETYDQVFLSDNGYINFLGPGPVQPVPGLDPVEEPAERGDLRALERPVPRRGQLDRLRHRGRRGHRAFVLEYDNVRVRGATAPIDFEIKLHENGETVDLLFGNNPANPGDGRGATIGIEDADRHRRARVLSSATPCSGRTAPIASRCAGRHDPRDRDRRQRRRADRRCHRGGDAGPRSSTTADDGTYMLRVYPATTT